MSAAEDDVPELPGSDGGEGAPLETTAAAGGADRDEAAEQRSVGPWYWRALVSLVLFHLAGVMYFAPPQVILAKQPVMTMDYALHVYQVVRARDAFKEASQLWGYDPLQLAGQPAGVVEDLTSKGTELWVIALNKLGVHPAIAFNLLLWVVHLSIPVLGYVGARLFRLSRSQALGVAWIWSWCWFFDSFMHWSWFIGMISWSGACALSVVLVGCLFRFLEERRLKYFMWFALVAATLAILHPFAVFAVAVPCAALYLRSAKTLGPKGHGLLLLAVALAGSTALIWIFPTLRFRHYVGDVDTFFNTTASYLLYDSFDLMKDGRNTGGPVRTLLRTLCFVASGVWLWRNRKAADRRWLPWLSFMLAGFAFTYFAGYLWLARQTQPYRQIGPVIFMAAIPAVLVFSELLSAGERARWTPKLKLLLGLGLVLIVPRVYRTMAYYVVHLLPEQVIRSDRDVRGSPLVSLNEPKPVWLGHAPAAPQQQAVRDWLIKHHKGRGRVAINEWVLGEYIAASTEIPVLGGIRERNVPHVDAHPYRQLDDGKLKPEELAAFFERYAVGFVIESGFRSPIEGQAKLIEPVEIVQGYRIYRVRAEPSYFLRGTGRVSAQRLNFIQVENAMPDAEGDVTLRFHYMESLGCRPECQVEREEVAGDRVGFIRVKAPPAKFEIFNVY
ncbi:MAG: hypothetical protein H6716_02420 [Polyangiaceae bacterium]|nr:hypothetical protein [Polyangiaceae bacterium]